jgi:hypothetical protein
MRTAECSLCSLTKKEGRYKVTKKETRIDQTRKKDRKGIEGDKELK